MKSPVIMILLLLFSCNSTIPEEKSSRMLDFYAPQKVTVSGYTGDIMEPFISKDGHYLFFNNLNEPSVNTNIFYAEKISDTIFQFRGEVDGVNSTALDGVASMDNNHNLYFVSTRSYSQNLSTVYQGVFDSGHVNAVGIVPGISRHEPGIVNFDAEVSADGNTLYFADGEFSANGQVQSADLVMATKQGGVFQRLANSYEILHAVNTSELEYAAGISGDELTLFFSRVPSVNGTSVPRIFYTTRENKNLPFNKPNELIQAEGFVEAATISGDSLVYYHKKTSSVFTLYCIRRK